MTELQRLNEKCLQFASVNSFDSFPSSPTDKQVQLAKDRKFTTLKAEASSDPKNAKTFNEELHPLYAHVYEDKSVQKVVGFYSHPHDTVTDVNLKRAIVRRLRTKPSDLVSFPAFWVLRFYPASSKDKQATNLNFTTIHNATERSSSRT